MGLRINTNIAAMAARRSLNHTSTNQQKSFMRLSSGQRITSAGDDAAGLSLSENLRAQIRSLSQAERNTQDGISLVQVAEGGMTEIGNIMIRLRELMVQGATDTLGDKERGFIDQEVQSLIREVDRIAEVTTFNGRPLLNAQSDKENLEFQVGIRNNEADRILFNTEESDVRADTLGITDVTSASIEDARESLDKLDSALGRINGARAGLGAMQNKLVSTGNNLAIAKENLAQARSRIADTDIAEETSKLVKENILQTAGVAVLAQANTAPQQALQLI